MNIYEDNKRYGKRQQHCGYCRQPGHNRIECPEVAKDWAWWKDYTVPPFSANIWKNRNHPDSWKQWYIDCRDTYEKQQAKKEKASTPVVRSAPKCGFCGGTGHNRRNCLEMAAFVDLCKKANHNYRKKIHQILVKELGIDIGAAIAVELRSWSGKSESNIGIITEINWDQINVFTAYQKDYDANNIYGQDINVKAMVDNQVRTIMIKTYVEERNQGLDLIKRESGYHSYHLSSVLGKSEYPLPEDWVTSYDDAWTFLTKKRSYERLRTDGVVAHIKKWAKQ